MPHYADGTPAQVGDKVVGKSYNDGKDGIVGTVVQITSEAETCNCVVAYVITQIAEPGPSPINTVYYYGRDATINIIPRYDYGETRAFTKVG